MNKRNKKLATTSRTSPIRGDRACLCRDGRTYDRKCCTGEMHAQGIGNT